MWNKMPHIPGLIIKIITRLNIRICVFPSSTMILLIIYTKRINDKAIILQSHSNIVADKGLNLLMNVLPDVYICPPKRKSAPFLPKGAVKCTQLTP